MKKVCLCLIVVGMFLVILNQNREIERLQHSCSGEIIVIEKNVPPCSPPPPPVNVVTIVKEESPGLIRTALHTTERIVTVVLATPLVLIDGIARANL